MTLATCMLHAARCETRVRVYVLMHRLEMGQRRGLSEVLAAAARPLVISATLVVLVVIIRRVIAAIVIIVLVSIVMVVIIVIIRSCFSCSLPGKASNTAKLLQHFGAASPRLPAIYWVI